MRKMVKRKFTGFIVAGRFFTSVLYIANEKAAASTHQSPFEKDRLTRLFIFPFVNNNSIPMMQMVMPVTTATPNFSFKNILARITARIGEEVVPIRARLMASE